MLRLTSVSLAIGIFFVDLLTPLESAVAVLYVVVVLLAARISRRFLIAAASAAVALTVLAFLEEHAFWQLDSSALRVTVSLVAIVIVTAMALENQHASATLRAQAELLNLSHDMIFVRDLSGAVTFWNYGATACYGWTSSEAQGRRADELLGTRYPLDRAAAEADLRSTGCWEGVLRQRTKWGDDIVVETRWALRKDDAGRPLGVLETHRDVTEREASRVALAESEAKYRRIFNTSRVGLIQQDWSVVDAKLSALADAGVKDLATHLSRFPATADELKASLVVTDVNPAMLAVVGADSPASFIAAMREVLREANQTLDAAILAFARGERFFEGETVLVTLKEDRVPVLFGLTFPDNANEPTNDVLIFVVDVAERERAKNALMSAQADLAHAARVATLGELTASIAHEVNQPLAAIITNSEAALRWLRRDVPDLNEIEVSLTRLISEGKRASAIVARIRSFLTKAPIRRKMLNIREVINDATLLVSRELLRHGVNLHCSMDPDLPPIVGDPVQLQQVMVNLMINGAQAMSGISDDRILTVRAERSGPEILSVTVQDTGPGISVDHLDRVFEPFFTTVDGGMGMGLAICRSTIEAHGGRLWVTSIRDHGAVFTFTLPFSQAALV